MRGLWPKLVLIILLAIHWAFVAAWGIYGCVIATAGGGKDCGHASSALLVSAVTSIVIAFVSVVLLCLSFIVIVLSLDDEDD